MPRFTYKDWVGRQASVVSRLSNRACTIAYEVGDLVFIAGYDPRLRFSITSLKRENQTFMWGIEPRKLSLIGQDGRSIREKAFQHLIQANAFGIVWVAGADIARAIDEELPPVLSTLNVMANEKFILRRPEEGKQRFRPRYRHVVEQLTRYDKLMSERDIFGP